MTKHGVRSPCQHGPAIRALPVLGPYLGTVYAIRNTRNSHQILRNVHFDDGLSYTCPLVLQDPGPGSAENGKQATCALAATVALILPLCY